MLLHAMSLLVQQRLQLEVELYRDRAKLIVLPPPCPQDVQPIDFSHAGDLIERALIDSRAFLDSLARDPSADTATASVAKLVPHTHV